MKKIAVITKNAKRIGEVLIVTLLVSACGGKNDNNVVQIPTTNVASCDETVGRCTYEYRIYNNGQLACEIPRQEFNNKSEFCQRLIDDSFNKFCVPDLRRQSYNNLCLNSGNQFSNFNQPGMNGFQTPGVTPFMQGNLNLPGTPQNATLGQVQPVQQSTIPSYVCASDKVNTSSFLFGLITITTGSAQKQLSSANPVVFEIGGGIRVYAQLDVRANTRVRVEVVDCNNDRFSVSVPAGQRMIISSNGPKGSYNQSIVCTPLTYTSRAQVDTQKNYLTCNGEAAVEGTVYNIGPSQLALNNSSPTGLIFDKKSVRSPSVGAEKVATAFSDIVYESNPTNGMASVTAKTDSRYGTPAVTVVTGYGTDMSVTAYRQGGAVQLPQLNCQPN